ncbi:MAG: hypothetical protein BWY85_02262 [Firmicutes bacterium ADurb.Bin506]|nr:MAG: hypothetical protein BWY85_02262 [Firmicutes bacterium ADurb.Bin506]
MIVRGRWMIRGSPVPATPTMAAATMPTMSWPSAPMLKSPALYAMASESPVKMSGVTYTLVSDRSAQDPKQPRINAA